MPELMLLSNSFSPGRGALEHALDALAAFFGDARQVLFVPYAASDPDGYTEAMREVLGRLGMRVSGAHRTADPVTALAGADAMFVGGGNAFRLLHTVQRNGLLAAIGSRARAGMPYLGVSAGANLACPTIRTSNDMPIVQPASLAALGLIPFQLNPHYPTAAPHDGPLRELRDRRLGEFLEENDVPVLGLCEGSWLRVSGTRATLGGTADGRVFTRGQGPPGRATRGGPHRPSREPASLRLTESSGLRTDLPDSPRLRPVGAPATGAAGSGSGNPGSSIPVAGERNLHVPGVGSAWARSQSGGCPGTGSPSSRWRVEPASPDLSPDGRYALSSRRRRFRRPDGCEFGVVITTPNSHPRDSSRTDSAHIDPEADQVLHKSLGVRAG